MLSRLELHTELCDILGSRNVYYQPPESLRIKYPAIIYSLEGIENLFSGNDIYLQKCTYRIIVVDSDPDSVIVNKIAKLIGFKHVNHYTSDNLNHDVFRVVRDEKPTKEEKL